MRSSKPIHSRFSDRINWAALAGAVAIGMLILPAESGFAQKGGGGAPPPNPEIAFMESGIKVMNADGTNVRTLVSSKTVYAPCWSPLGDKLAYFDMSASNGGIWTVKLDGTAKTRIAAFPANGQVSIPDWSRGTAPDGNQKIAFAVHAPGGSGDIYICNPDGTGLLNVTNTPTASEHYVAWSRNSSQLVVTRSDAAPLQLVQIQLGMVDGNLAVVSELPILLAAGYYPGGHMRWANNSDTVVYENSGLWLLDVALGTSRRLTSTSSDQNASFSPDDSKIACGRGSIRKINAADGSSLGTISGKGSYAYWKRPPLP